jgi:hypothetical protein
MAKLAQGSADRQAAQSPATASYLGLSYHQLRNVLKKHGLLGPKAS